MSNHTNFPITLTFEPVQKDLLNAQNIPNLPGVYILGVMKPIDSKDTFCPLYVGKTYSKGLLTNFRYHFNSKRAGFFHGNPTFDVLGDFRKIYADISILYRTKPKKDNVIPRFRQIQKGNDTLLWYNSKEFYNTIFNQSKLYVSSHAGDYNERQNEMSEPNGGHWTNMTNVAITLRNKKLQNDIDSMKKRFDDSRQFMKNNFAFTYAVAQPNSNGYSPKLLLEEAATKLELQRRSIWTTSAANGLNNPAINNIHVDLSKVVNLYKK